MADPNEKLRKLKSAYPQARVPVTGETYRKNKEKGFGSGKTKPSTGAATPVAATPVAATPVAATPVDNSGMFRRVSTGRKATDILSSFTSVGPTPASGYSVSALSEPANHEGSTRLVKKTMADGSTGYYEQTYSVSPLGTGRWAGRVLTGANEFNKLLGSKGGEYYVTDSDGNYVKAGNSTDVHAANAKALGQSIDKLNETLNTSGARSPVNLDAPVRGYQPSGEQPVAEGRSEGPRGKAKRVFDSTREVVSSALPMVRRAQDVADVASQAYNYTFNEGTAKAKSALKGAQRLVDAMKDKAAATGKMSDVMELKKANSLLATQQKGVAVATKAAKKAAAKAALKYGLTEAVAGSPATALAYASTEATVKQGKALLDTKRQLGASWKDVAKATKDVLTTRQGWANLGKGLAGSLMDVGNSLSFGVLPDGRKVRATMQDSKGGAAGDPDRFSVSRNFLATDKVPDSIFGIPVVSKAQDYTPADREFFRRYPEAGGYYDLGDEGRIPAGRPSGGIRSSRSGQVPPRD